MDLMIFHQCCYSTSFNLCKAPRFYSGKS